MRKIMALGILVTLVWLVGCSGPLYTRIDDNKNYWGFADARGQLQAIAIKRIADTQGVTDKEKRGSVQLAMPIAQRDKIGIIINRRSCDMIIRIYGPNFKKSFLLEAGGTATEKLSLNEIYLYTVETTDGQIYCHANLRPLVINDEIHQIQWKKRTFKVCWWINIQ